jgi:hypothetical protein
LGLPGLRPFNMFPQAFRVWALFEASPERISLARGSHYRTKLTDDASQVGKANWWSDSVTAADDGFRDSLFQSIDTWADSLNLQAYDGGVDNGPGGEIGGRYRRLYVVMLARADSIGPANAGDSYRPSGRSFSVPRAVGAPATDWVKVGIGRGEVHEWGHTFGYITDEYILERGSTASKTNPATRTLWNLYNIAFSNNRPDLLWPHLAPGGRYNAKIRSMIGNLWVGSSQGETGSWHSEYKCQINGGVENYRCSYSAADTAWLRDSDHYCFWCEEIMALRILERVGEFQRLSPGGAVLNDALGQQWWNYWDQSLRHGYYTYFNYDSLIAAKNECYALYEFGSGCIPCSTNCNTDTLPSCLPDCAIREIGNAIYVDPSQGAFGNPGTKEFPVRTIVDGVFRANVDVPETPILVLQRGSYSGAITISDPAFLITDGCAPVTVGD